MLSTWESWVLYILMDYHTIGIEVAKVVQVSEERKSILYLVRMGNTIPKDSMWITKMEFGQFEFLDALWRMGIVKDGV